MQHINEMGAVYVTGFGKTHQLATHKDNYLKNVIE